MFENVCRACLQSSNEMISLYDELCGEKSYINMYENLCLIEIQKCDKITKNLCLQCLADLKNAFYFKQKCIQSYKKITEYINIEENSNENFNENGLEASQEVVTELNSKSIFKCQVCNKVYRLQKLFDKHIQSHESNQNKHEVSKKHLCEFCNKEFPFKSSLAEHMKNHTGEKPYLCSFCGKGFRQKGGLDYHVRYHTGFKPFFCNICHTSFVSQNILKVHMRRHTNERPYVCDICGRAFRQNTDMRTHRRTQHTLSNEDNALITQSMIECNVCNKRLTKSGALTVHMRIHTGERPFKCDTCNKGFVTRSLMLRHKRIHTKERPYVCKICERGFNQSSSLNTHMKTHNKVSKKSKK